jgi:hypothetical protein
VSLLLLNKGILDGWGVAWDDAAIRTRGEMLARTRYLPTNQPANRPTDRGVLAGLRPLASQKYFRQGAERHRLPSIAVCMPHGRGEDRAVS